MTYSIQRFTQIHAGDAELEQDRRVIIEYDYTAGSPATMYAPNGDPGHPGEPSDVEILSVTDNDTGEDLMAAVDMDSIEQYVLENHEPEPSGPDPDEFYDRNVCEEY